MSVKRLGATAVGLPVFAFDNPAPPGDGQEGRLFDLSSHRRARQAIAFGLSISDPGFNIFVLGEDRSGRMTATLEYVKAHVENRPPPSDWVYLNNFQQPNEPRPYELSAGTGRHFRDAMAALIPGLRDALRKAFEAPAVAEELSALKDGIKSRVDADFASLRSLAQTHGLDVQPSPRGLILVMNGPDGQPIPPDRLSEEDKARAGAASQQIDGELQAFVARTQAAEADLSRGGEEIRRAAATRAIAPLFDALQRAFADHAPLARWLSEMRADVLDGLSRFQPGEGEREVEIRARLEERYAVNLLVDHGDDAHPSVVLEPNPTYENLFGTIEYHSVSGVAETNYTMIRAGALHRANGGILVLRAEALANQETAWEFLKAALRDREIRIEELHRANAIPIFGAPRPKPIPLDVKVVIVGAPQWYYSFFSADRDFQAYFKVKADIDPDMDATDCNIEAYTKLIHQAAGRIAEIGCAPDAVAYLLGQSARWAEHRNKLTARFELLQDVLCEAGVLARAEGDNAIAAAHIRRALEDRLDRNSRMEDRSQEHIRRRLLMIDTQGAAIGQVNAITARDMGDYAFALPVRITARTFVGKLGVINIERATALGGPIQQKGVMVLEGLLNGRLAQRFPLSFSCSITFEQSYSGGEGDSASLAELCAILSALAQVPVRQDSAITGSLNQFGEAQAVGAVNTKVEGFYRTCAEAGLTGEQGVMIPAANEPHLTLRDEVAEAIGRRAFHVWSVETADDAIELLTGIPAGEADGDGTFPPESVYGRASRQLEAYDRILTERAAPRD